MAEAADLLGVHRNTIRNYQRHGLPVLSTRVGVLIQGEVLRAYLTKRKAAAKAPCPPGTMYCFRCRAPRRPPPELVELTHADRPAANLRGLCPDCGTWMHRRIGRVGPEAAGFVTSIRTSAPIPSR